MKKVLISTLLAALLTPCTLIPSSFAEEKKAMMKPSDSNAPANIISNAANAYSALSRSGAGIPSSVLSKAQCVVVVPKVVTAAVVVGGSHGNGVASCKNNGKWSSPAFVDMNSASLGVQLGGKSSDVAMFLTNTSAVDKLKAGNLKIGADASVVAGNFDRAFDTGTAGIVAYENASGAFLGASINGGYLSSAQDSNRAFYGRDVSITNILNGQAGTQKENEAANSFISQLPV